MPEDTSYNAIPEKTLTLRWRLKDGALPLAHRHVTSLLRRGAGASLYAYVQTRVEQLLSGEVPVKHPNGMVLVTIQPDGEIAITIEDRPESPSVEDTELKVNDKGDVVDAGDASVWVRDGRVITTPQTPPAASRGSRSLVLDLVKTLGYEVREEPVERRCLEDADEAFLVSDLFGVIALNEKSGELSQKLADAFARLWE